VNILDKSVAQDIYDIADKELKEKGKTGWETIMKMKAAVEKVGRNHLDYFFPSEDGNDMIFNLKRWQRHFIEGEIAE